MTVTGASVATAWFIMVGQVLYFVPTLVAMFRHHPEKYTLFLINAFYGWTVVGWLLALAWAFQIGSPPEQT